MDPASEDALSLFGHEPGGSTPVPDRMYSSETPDAVSLDRLVDAGPLRFVEGIAVVQAMCAAVKEKGGPAAGMPDSRGVFLNESGEVVVMTPPAGEPAAPELARLLHRLVPAESTPPVARLFIDRWTSGASTDLNAFASEIGYFARPNGRDVLITIHRRLAAVPGMQPPVVPPPVVPPPVLPFTPLVTQHVAPLESEKAEEKAAQPEPMLGAQVNWLRSHSRQIVAAGALIASIVAITGLVTWFWPAREIKAAEPPVPPTINAAADETGERDSTVPAAKPVATGAVAPKPVASGSAPQPRVSRPGPRSTTPRSASAPLSAAPDRSPQDGTERAVARAGVAASAPPTAVLPARGLPDMRIYSMADEGIEPPKLRSAGIREGLISGFPTKTNSVEVFVDREGHVERVRMQGAPQRIPDIMILSRVKEWLFDPATKDGTAVRYRLLLSWDVTP